MDERHAVSLGGQFQHPVQSGIAAAENHQPLAVEVAGVLDPVVNRGALEGVGTLDADPARLERADTRSDYDRAGVEDRTRRRPDLKSSVFAPREFEHFL